MLVIVCIHIFAGMAVGREKIISRMGSGNFIFQIFKFALLVQHVKPDVHGRGGKNRRVVKPDIHVRGNNWRPLNFLSQFSATGAIDSIGGHFLFTLITLSA